MIGLVALADLPASQRPRLLHQAEQIFFETANVASFSSPAEKAAFRRRWFGNYAKTQPQHFLLAQDGSDAVGYLAGCVDSFSAVSKTIFRDISYFTPDFGTALSRYPSHFHINLTARYHRRGIGSLLVARWVTLCIESASPGIHVVTGAASPAVDFYEACGFKRIAGVPGIGSESAVLVYETGR